MEEKILVRTQKQSLLALYLSWVVYSALVSYCFGLFSSGITGCAIDSQFFSDVLVLTCIVFVIWAIIGTIMHQGELTVTNRRAYGKAAFGKRVDLPLDSISAVATGMFKRVTISTSSGYITFWGVQNLDEFHSVLSELIIERQNKPAATTIKQEIPQSNADELKKYKELLDSGVITQEEFDVKKKQLLGL